MAIPPAKQPHLMDRAFMATVTGLPFVCSHGSCIWRVITCGGTPKITEAKEKLIN
jgi:hypothetical protein